MNTLVDVDKARTNALKRERYVILREEAERGWFPRRVGLQHNVYGPRIKAAVDAAVAAAEAHNRAVEEQREIDGAWLKKTC